MNDHLDDAEARLRRAAHPATAAPALDPALVSGAPDRHAPRLVRHGRVARATTLSMTALAAVTAGALVIANPFAGPQQPLFQAAGAGGGNELAATSDAARMMIAVDYDFVAGPDLSTSTGRGSVYELRRAGTPESVLTRAAAALGLNGEVVESEYSSPEYPVYVVGPEDGSGPAMNLSWSGTGSWWYGNPNAYPLPVCHDVEIEGTDGETYQDCSQPAIPPAGSEAPSEAEARRLASEFFAAIDFPVDTAKITVVADEWQTLATASLEVDGISTAVESSIAWSPLGKISWASGHSFELVERGQYDTISHADAVARLEDGRWYGAAGSQYAGEMVAFAASSLARDAVVSMGDGTDGEEPAQGEPGTGSDDVEPTDPGEPAEPEAPVDDVAPETPEEPEVEEPKPVQTPDPVTVTLTTSESTLLLVWDVDGNAWLVPGAAYDDPDHGFWRTVITLVEGVIALPEPFVGEPEPFFDDTLEGEVLDAQ